MRGVSVAFGYRVGDLAYGLPFGLGLAQTGLCLTFGAKYGRFLFAFRAGNRSLLLTFGPRDRGLLFAFRVEYYRPFITLGGHLFFHRYANIFGRMNISDLNASDLYTPSIRRFIKYCAEFVVNYVSRSKCVI